MIDINTVWQELRERVAACKKCGLCDGRTNTVFGDGSINSKVVIIGEAPGEEEDATGHPFVGKAGQLLTAILEKGGNIPRQSVYITNVVKCRPPKNRDPEPKEMFLCREYLEAQLLLLRPQIVVTMGNISTRAILHTSTGITSLRGQWFNWRGIKVFPMFHPSYLLRNESRAKGSPKDLTYQDIKALKAEIDKLNTERNI